MGFLPIDLHSVAETQINPHSHGAALMPPAPFAVKYSLFGAAGSDALAADAFDSVFSPFLAITEHGVILQRLGQGSPLEQL